MASFCWQLLLITVGLYTVHSLTITPVPYGVIALRRGEARVQAGSFDVTIVRRHPARTSHWLRPIEMEISALLNHLRPQRPHQVYMYQARLDGLRRSRRHKRGYINAIGSLSKTLFGTATEKDVEKVRNKVNEIIEDNQELKTVVKGTVVCVNELREQQQRVQQKTNELVRKLNELKTVFNTMVSVQSDLAKRMYFEELSNNIESGISYLEACHAESLKYQSLFQYRRDLAVVGHLTETLMSRERLVDLLKEINVKIPLEYLYQHADVTIMKLDTQKLGFYFSIPILDGESYTAWDISSVPFLAGGRPHQLQPELFHVGVGLNSGKIIELEYCKYEEPIICPSPLQYDKLDCVQGILAHNIEKIKECDVDELPQHSLKVKRLSPGSLLLYTQGETIEERCKLKPAQTNVMSGGTYVISAETGCVLESTHGWKFQMFEIYKRVMNVTDDVVYLQVADIMFEIVQEPITMVPVKFNISLLAEQIYQELPDTAVLDRRINMLTFSGSVVSYIILIGVCIAIMFMLYYYIRRKYKERKPAKVIEPTVAMDNANKTVPQCHNTNSHPSTQ